VPQKLESGKFRDKYDNLNTILLYRMSINLDIVNKTTCLCAKRNSGKSVLLKYLVDSVKSEFFKVYVVCPTEAVNKFYSDMVEENCIYDQWNEEWCGALITKMSEKNKGKTKKELNNVLIILDDCMSDTNFHQSQNMKKLLTRGRHVGIGVIITCQYLNSLPPVARNNSDNVIVGQLNRASVQLLAGEFLSGDLEKPDFIKLYNRATQDYGFLVIKNTSIKESSGLNQLYGIVKTPPEYVV
jgi:Poxvirus A32 protein